MPAQQRQPLRMSTDEFRALHAGRRHVAKPASRRKLQFPIGEVAQLPLVIQLPFLPPSINKLFCTVRDADTGATLRVLTSHARRIRKLICAMVRARLAPQALYELQVDVYLNAFTHAGQARQVDVSNRIKFLEDCLCFALGIDDRQFFRVVATKHDSQQEHTLIRIDRFAHPKRDAA
jgi:Holliday junction resolvase RusA-like endonuclease